MHSARACVVRRVRGTGSMSWVLMHAGLVLHHGPVSHSDRVQDSSQDWHRVCLALSWMHLLSSFVHCVSCRRNCSCSLGGRDEWYQCEVVAEDGRPKFVITQADGTRLEHCSSSGEQYRLDGM